MELLPVSLINFEDIIKKAKLLVNPPTIIKFESPQEMVVAYSIISYTDYNCRYNKNYKKLNLSWVNLPGLIDPTKNNVLAHQVGTITSTIRDYNETAYNISGASEAIWSDLHKMRAIPEFKKSIEICDNLLGIDNVNVGLKNSRPDLFRHDVERIGITSFFSGNSQSLSRFTSESLEGYWIISLRDLILVTEPPKYVRTDENGQLHCKDGPAIEYKNGFQIWAWRGWYLKKEYILNPNSLPYNGNTRDPYFEGLFWIENYKHFYDLAELVGYSYFFEKVKSRVPLDEDYDRTKCHRQLVQLKWGNWQREDLHLLVLGDGKDRAYLKVPKDIETCAHAVAWSFGKRRVRDYQPIEET